MAGQHGWQSANGRPTARVTRPRYGRWALGGGLLLGAHIYLAAISSRFAYGSPFSARPILPLVGILACTGAAYIWAAWEREPAEGSRAVLVWILLVGTALRGVMLASTPMLEDDYYRYLWDGGVVAHGANPYEYSPAEAMGMASDGRPVPASLRRLAEQSGQAVERANHPQLRTIYPPVAQAAFALAHALTPWRLLGWRLVLLCSDLAAAALLAALLRVLRLPLTAIALYWWNPLIVKELFNSAHMDGLVLPFVLAAVWLALKERHALAAGALALAVGVKLWPVVLLPVLLRSASSSRARMIRTLFVFVLVAAAIMVPFCRLALGPQSGLGTYGRTWEMNDALFMVFAWCVRRAVQMAGLAARYTPLAARAGVLAALSCWILWLVRKPFAEPAAFCAACLYTIAAVFLLSPTQFPWYYVWLVPFLALRPRLSLLLLTVMLPLYYSRFYLHDIGRVSLFHYGVVWVEYVPVWGLLIWEALRARRSSHTVVAPTGDTP